MKLAARLGALSAANIALTFLYQAYVVASLGPGVDTDALFAGMTIPQLVVIIVGGSLTHVLVPLLAGERQDRLRETAWSFIVLIGTAFALIAIGLHVAAAWWVPWTVPGFDSATRALTVDLTRIQLISIVFAVVNSVQAATYHARHRFAWVEVSAIGAGVVSLLAVAWSLPRFGVFAAAWITVLRAGLQCVLLTPGLGAPARPNLKAEAVRAAARRVRPLLLGGAYYKSDDFIDRFLLSLATAGSITLYYFAQQLYRATGQMLNRAIVIPMVPALGQLHVSCNTEDYRRLYARKFLQMATISAAILIAVLVVGRWALEQVAVIGQIDVNDVYELWWILMWLSGMFFGGAVGQVVSSAYYACGNTTTPTRVSIVTFTLYIPAKVLAFYEFGVMGLALTTSVYYMTNLVVLSCYLRRDTA